MKYQQWSIPELPAGAVDRLTGAGYPYLVSSVLASRGITTPEEAAAFLERDRDLPYSPFLMKDMDKAAQRVSRALAGGEKIAVFGDYDVDGITATVILVDYLLSRGGDVVHYIPRRIEDGYGLGKDAILSQGANMLALFERLKELWYNRQPGEHPAQQHAGAVHGGRREHHPQPPDGHGASEPADPGHHLRAGV